MTRDDTTPKTISIDPDSWKFGKPPSPKINVLNPHGATMTRDDITMPIDGLVIKQPEYDCPTHGTVVGTITFSRADTGTVRRFCMECCFDKMVEIGVCEVTEKKP